MNCRKCNVELTEENTTPSLYLKKWVCKYCKRQLDKEYRLKNKEKIRAKDREYYLKIKIRYMINN